MESSSFASADAKQPQDNTVINKVIFETVTDKNYDPFLGQHEPNTVYILTMQSNRVLVIDRVRRGDYVLYSPLRGDTADYFFKSYNLENRICLRNSIEISESSQICDAAKKLLRFLEICGEISFNKCLTLQITPSERNNVNIFFCKNIMNPISGIGKLIWSEYWKVYKKFQKIKKELVNLQQLGEDVSNEEFISLINKRDASNENMRWQAAKSVLEEYKNIINCHNKFLALVDALRAVPENKNMPKDTAQANEFVRAIFQKAVDLNTAIIVLPEIKNESAWLMFKILMPIFVAGAIAGITFGLGVALPWVVGAGIVGGGFGFFARKKIAHYFSPPLKDCSEQTIHDMEERIGLKRSG